MLKSQLQTIESQTVGLNSVETEFSQMPNLLGIFSHDTKLGVCCTICLHVAACATLQLLNG